MEQHPYSWIDSDQALIHCCQILAQAKVLAVDTEFMRTSTFYPQAALFQINDDKHTYLIDPLAIKDFGSLIDLFTRDDIVKVFHSCSEDLEVILYFLGCVPHAIVDTQIAAALLNIGSAVGYGNLVKHLLDVELDKGETRSDWLQRPLQTKQIAYAVQDVAYLLPVYNQLMQALAALNRVEWWQEECANLLVAANTPVPIEDYYLKIKSAWKLNRQQLAVLKHLCVWRERKARSLDIPRNHVVPEKALMSLAYEQPTDSQAFKKIEDVNRFQRQHYGEELIAKITEVRDADKNTYPTLLTKPLSSEQKKLVKVLKEEVEHIAEHIQLPTEVLAKKQDLEQLVRSAAKGEIELPPRLSGWRKRVVGDQLLKCLQQSI